VLWHGVNEAKTTTGFSPKCKGKNVTKGSAYVMMSSIQQNIN